MMAMMRGPQGQGVGPGDEYQSHGVAKIDFTPRVEKLNKQLYR